VLVGEEALQDVACLAGGSSSGGSGGGGGGGSNMPLVIA
jgi:hypothetical protein